MKVLSFPELKNRRRVRAGDRRVSDRRRQLKFVMPLPLMLVVVMVFSLFAGIYLGTVTTASAVYTTCMKDQTWSWSSVLLERPMAITCNVK